MDWADGCAGGDQADGSVGESDAAGDLGSGVEDQAVGAADFDADIGRLISGVDVNIVLFRYGLWCGFGVEFFDPGGGAFGQGGGLEHHFPCGDWC